MNINLFTLITLIINYWNVIINNSFVLINILLVEFIWALIIISINSVFLTQVASFESKQETESEMKN